MADEQEPASNPEPQPEPQPQPQLPQIPASEPAATDAAAAPKISDLEDVAQERLAEEEDHFSAGNTALADALSKSFTALKFIMVALVVVFVLSGFFTVDSDKVAIRTRFGKIIPGPDGETLTSQGGPYFRWPSPIGEVYEISTAPRSVQLANSFTFGETRQPINIGKPLREVGSQRPQYDPTLDGFLLTGDQNIVHARYTITYRVDPARAADFMRNVAGPVRDPNDPDAAVDWSLIRARENLLFQQAEQLVTSAVEQSIVTEIAGQSVDQFLANQLGQRQNASPATPTTPAAPTTPTPDATSTTPDASAQPSPTDSAVDPAADPMVDATGGDTAGTSTETPTNVTPATPQQPAAARQSIVEARAQRILDEARSGLVIDAVLLDEQSVPPIARPAFEAKTVIRQQVDDFRQRALADRAGALVQTAGDGYAAVLAVIEAYETADRLVRAEPDDPAAREALGRASDAIDAAFGGEDLGQAVAVAASALPEGDPRLERFQQLSVSHANRFIGGAAQTTMRSAETRRNQIRNNAENEADRFNRLLEKHAQAPRLVEQEIFLQAIAEIFENAAAIEIIPAGKGPIVIREEEDPERIRARREARAAQAQPTGPAEGPPQ